jgi:hypothetical protein
VLRRFCSASEGLATVEYIIGAAALIVVGATRGDRPRDPTAVRGRKAPGATRAASGAAAGSAIHLVTPDLARSGLGWTEGDLVRAKLVLALVGAAITAAIGLFVPIGALVVAAVGYAGFIAPTLRVERVAAFRRSEAEDAVVALVEWAEALAASGRPIEAAFVAIAERGVGAALIDRAIAAAARSYALGAPLFPALGSEVAAARMPRPRFDRERSRTGPRSRAGDAGGPSRPQETRSAPRNALEASTPPVGSKDGSCSFWCCVISRR